MNLMGNKSDNILCVIWYILHFNSILGHETLDHLTLHYELYNVNTLSQIINHCWIHNISPNLLDNSNELINFPVNIRQFEIFKLFNDPELFITNIIFRYQRLGKVQCQLLFQCEPASHCKGKIRYYVSLSRNSLHVTWYIAKLWI